MRISDWSSDVCSSDLSGVGHRAGLDHRSAAARRPGVERSAARSGRLAMDAARHPLGRRGGAGPADARAGLDPGFVGGAAAQPGRRSEEHTSELKSLMLISYAVFCLIKKKLTNLTTYL